VLAGRRRRQSHLPVHEGRTGDADGVDFALAQHLLVVTEPGNAHLAGEFGTTRLVGIGDGSNARALQGADRLGMAGTHAARADDPNAYRLLHTQYIWERPGSLARRSPLLSSVLTPAIAAGQQRCCG